MGNLKPFQVIVMGVFVLVAVIGLFVFANFNGFDQGAARIGTVTIWGTLPEYQMNPALNAFKENRQDMIGVSYVERPAATFDTDLANAIASGRGPDLIILTQEDLETAQEKLTLISSDSISERDYRDTYLPISELFLVQGGTYGIPFLVDPLMLYYNRTTLAAAGAATPPATWEAVSGLAASVNRLSDAQTVLKSLIALGTFENIEHARDIISLLFIQAGYGITERTSAGMRATLMDPLDGAYGGLPSESALTYYLEFANPTKTVYSWNRSLPNNRTAFIAGDLALYPGYASERAALTEANPNLQFDMAPMPSPGTAYTRSTYGRVYAFAIPRASVNPNGAYQVALALSDADAVPLFARAVGMAPAARMALAPNRNDLYEPVYYPEALIARAWLSPAPVITDRIFATMVSDVTSGREPVVGALNAATQALNAALR